MKAEENTRDVIPQTTSSVSTLMTHPPTAFSLEVVLNRYTEFEVRRPSVL